MRVDETHDRALASWVESARADDTDFPVQNLPLGAFRRAPGERARIGCAIGAHVLDLAACADAGLLTGLPKALVDAAQAPALNAYLALSSEVRRTLRHRLSHLLRAEGAQVTARTQAAAVLVAQDAVEMTLPAEVGDYTDFYASVHHATNVGRLFRPDQPLLPNYKHVPIGYHGRASSLVPSGTPVRRPSGQTEPKSEGDAPSWGPSRRLDYELEAGLFVGPGNALGTPVGIRDAGAHVAGLCLVNDWSARDVQKWEYQPLGPFLAKSFATTVSPWLVTVEALAPFRVPAAPRPDGDPRPLPYLLDEQDQQAGAFDVALTVWLCTARMRELGLPAAPLSASNLRDLYWTPAQMVAHHASNGCNLRPGDLMATGTVSGPEPGARGCLLELTNGGRVAVTLPSGEERRFLEDGDEVTLRGRATRDGFITIGFGSCRGTILPAHGDDPARSS
jgi:fumarylacetoacetase